MAQVGSHERRLARLMASDAGRYESRGVAAAAQAGFRAMRKAIAAWKAGRYPEVAAIAGEELMAAQGELRDAMALAYMLGVKRTRAHASLSLSATTTALMDLRRQLKLDEAVIERIRSECDAKAFRVLANASYAVEQRLQAAILRAVSEGAHVREGTRILGKAFGASGITPQSSFQLEAIFRTQMQMSYSAAKWAADQDPAIDEILWGYKYVTVGDSRVRLEHQGLDGVTLPKGDTFWSTDFPPNGWACRCQAIEIFEERDIVEAPAQFEAVDEFGRAVIVAPGADEGFRFNPGMIWSRMDLMAA